MKQNNSLQQKSWIFGTMIGCVLLEIIYRIFLQNQFGATGLALFEPAYALYMFLWVVGAIGIPTAVSHIISARMEKGDRNSTQSILMICLATSAGFGLLICVVLWLASGSIAKSIGLPNATNLLRWMAPGLFLVTILGAFRGYFLGMRMKVICDISIAIEQIFKVIVGIIFVLIWNKSEIIEHITGAMIGIIVSYVIALIFLGVMYMLGIDQVNHDQVQEKKTKIKIGPMMGRLIGQEINISIGAGSFFIMMLIDACMSIGLLAPKGGQTLLPPSSSYGVLAGVAWPLVLFPVLLSMVLCKRQLTQLEYTAQKQHPAMIQKRVNSMIKIAFMIGLLWTGLLWSLADPIAAVFFINATEQEIWMLANLIRLIAVASLFGAVGQIASQSIQKLGFDIMALIAVIFAVIVKIIVMQIVPSMLNEPIFGIAFSSVIALGIIAVVALVYVTQFSKATLSMSFYGPRALIAIAISGIVIYYLSTYILFVYIPSIVAMILDILVYLLLALGICIGLGAISRRDIQDIAAKRILSRNQEASQE